MAIQQARVRGVMELALISLKRKGPSVGDSSC